MLLLLLLLRLLLCYCRWLLSLLPSPVATLLMLVELLLLVSAPIFVISACVPCHSGPCCVVVRCNLLRDVSRACELTITMMMMIVQAVFRYSVDPSRVATFASCIVTLTGQCKTLLSWVSGSVENRSKCAQCGQTGRGRVSRRS